MSFVFLTSCSGGSSSSDSSDDTDVSGLEIGEQMALVTAQDDSGSGSISGLMRAAILAAVPTSGAYITDVPELYVYDESMEVLDEINSIMCMIGQTRYPDMVNLGDYIAMIDTGPCDRREDHSSDSSNQSSSETESFEKWTVNSSRASNSSPHVVNAWIELTDDDFADEIHAQMVVTEAASATNPFGLFTINFSEFMEGELAGTGNLTVSETDLGFIDIQMNIGDGSEQVHAVLTPGEDSGVAFGSRLDFGGPDGEEGAEGAEGAGEGSLQTIGIAFDSAHYLTSFETLEGTRNVCMDRVNFNKNVWRYNLYDETGAVVDRNSGFGIKIGESDTGDNFAWAGYWGIWVPDHLTLTNGDQVTDDEGENTYTFTQANGRVIKRTKGEMTLADLEGDTYQWSDWEDGTAYTVEWNGTNFVKTGTQSCGENGCEITALDPEEVMEFETYEWFGIWKQGFGSVNCVTDENGAFSADQTCTYFTEEFVTPSDDMFANGDVTLYCYFDCPKPNLTADDFNNGTTYSDNKTQEWVLNEETDQWEPEELPEPYVYILDSNFNLTYGGESVSISDAEAANVDPFGLNGWGTHSGAMLTSTEGMTAIWEAWDQAVSYNYETGPNEWNKYSGLIDSNGDAVAFDPPLQCLYESEENGTYLLDYSGEGELHGIPFEKIEKEDSDFEHWRAKFAIEDGTELTCGDATYYVRQMTIEQSMQEEEDSSECNTLSIDNLPSAPTNEFTDPEMGDAPTVTNAPAVIGGVLQ